MALGIKVPAIAVDQHIMHIKNHRSVLSDPDMRTDSGLIQVVLDHIQEHITLLQSVDPALLQMLGEQPIAPQQPQNPPSEIQIPPTEGPPQVNNTSLPQPAAPFEGAPVTAQQQYAKIVGQ
jgi:hypothetical protein